MSVSSNIKRACLSLNTTRNQGTEEIPEDIYGGIAMDVAEVAKMCKIPDNEVLFESVGQNTCFKRASRDIFADCGPSCIKQRTYQHWYHVGQSYQHSAAWLEQQQPGSPGGQAQPSSPGQHYLHMQLQKQLMQRLGGGSMRALESSDGSSSLQSAGSSGSAQERIIHLDSSNSTPTAAAANAGTRFSTDQ